jgi:hypothetical protein
LTAPGSKCRHILHTYSDALHSGHSSLRDSGNDNDASDAPQRKQAIV